MRGCSSKAVAVCAFALALSDFAYAQEEQATEPAPVFELASDRVVVRTKTGESFVAIGCQPRSFASFGTRAYALCGSRTIVIVDSLPQPRVVERRFLKKVIVSLTLVNDVISARSADGVRPLDEYAVNREPLATVVTTPSRDLPPDVTRHDRGTGPETTPPARTTEMSLLATSGIGVDSPTGAFTYLDAAIALKFESFPLVLATYGTIGAATGSFDPGDRSTLARGGDVQVAVAELLAGIDIRYFAIQAGIGVGMFANGYDVNSLFVTRGRIGERDRFELDWHMSFGISGNEIVGVMGGIFEFRLRTAWWLGIDAEMGNLRYGRFMVDARHRIAGDGGRHTVDLRASVGLAYVQSGVNCDTSFNGVGDETCVGTNASYLGPALSFGVLWRP